MHDLAALRWLLTSPPLLSSVAAQQFNLQTSIAQFTVQEQQAIEPWLAQVEAAPQALINFLNQARSKVRGHQPGVLRLGRYAEKLLEFFLLHGPTHQLAAANIPLRHPQAERSVIDHTTRGELDFLLHDRQGKPLHWELAVKYFLCHAQGIVAQADDFIGPDAAETFSRKLTKLFGRQLAHTPPAPYDKARWQPQAFARGWMFYRYGRAIPSCALLNPDHCKGWWLPFEELEVLPDAQYVLLDRQHWMPPAHITFDEHAMTQTQLRSQLLQHWHDIRGPHISALLIAQLNADGHEIARYFVGPHVNNTSNLKHF
jgi:uncharacterized protein